MSNMTNDTSLDKEACIPAHVDPGLGVFETILVESGRPIELDRHLERLRESAEGLFEVTLDLEAIRTETTSRAIAVDLGRLRINGVPNGPVETEIVTSALNREILFPSPPMSPSLCSVAVPGGSLGCHKWIDRTFISRCEMSHSSSLPLFVTEDSGVLEVSRGNIFLVEANTLLTPPSDGRILPGVTRRRVMELGPSLGFIVEEVDLTLDRLLNADGVFMTGSLRGIEPVTSVDGKEIKAATETISMLSDALKALWFQR